MAKKIRISRTSRVEIQTGTASKTGGKTGSACVADVNNEFYQYKPPIIDNSFSRRAKADFTDSENFGERLAACIAGKFDKDKDKNRPRVPEVAFVTDDDSRYVGISSKYLKSEKGARQPQSLDEFLRKPAHKSHIKLVSGKHKPDDGIHNIDKDPILKQEIADAIALSALVGDPDVNPGNMLVLHHNDNPPTFRVGRIVYI
jgi:hypothetical protein